MSDRTDSIGLITEDIVDTLRSNTKAIADNLAENYYDKATIQELLTAGITTVLVDELPEVGDAGIIYLVPVSSTENNLYKEYIYISNDDGGVWEEIGSTEFDIDNYYDKDTTDELLDDKMDASTPIPSTLGELTNDKGFLTLVVINELPETGEAGILYAVPATTIYKDGNEYDEYVWIDGKYEQVGDAECVEHQYLTDNYYNNTETYNNDEIIEALENAQNVIDFELAQVNGNTTAIGYIGDSGYDKLTCDLTSTSSTSEKLGNICSVNNTNEIAWTVSEYYTPVTGKRIRPVSASIRLDCEDGTRPAGFNYYKLAVVYRRDNEVNYALMDLNYVSTSWRQIALPNIQFADDFVFALIVVPGAIDSVTSALAVEIQNVEWEIEV